MGMSGGNPATDPAIVHNFVLGCVFYVHIYLDTLQKADQCSLSNDQSGKLHGKGYKLDEHNGSSVLSWVK